MKEEWREAVKATIASNPEMALIPVSRTGLPMPARDPFDEEDKRAHNAGGQHRPRLGKFVVEGKTVFLVRGVDDLAGNGRIHLYDPAGHLIERGAIQAGIIQWE